MKAGVLARAALIGLSFAYFSRASAVVATDDADNPPTAVQPPEEQDRAAPIDFGPGRGLPRPSNKAAAPASRARAASDSNAVAGSDAAVAGWFGPPVSWPIIPLHAALLPDGRVINYGTDQNGVQGGQIVYDVWDPSLGAASDAHLVLPNTTATDIFCSAQTLVATTGTVLVTGGDMTVNKTRNYGRNSTNLFVPKQNALVALTPMTYARWYGSLVALPNGEILTLGGRESGPNPMPLVAATTPEIFNPHTGWRTLPGADSVKAFSAGQNWYYPRAFVAPKGNVFTIGANGSLFWLDAGGTGGIAPAGRILASTNSLPSLMFAPGRILSLRSQSHAVIVDINGRKPVVTSTADVSQTRYWASGTVLADGQVLLTGGSAMANQLQGLAYQAEIWNPTTGLWTLGAGAAKPRLYHSIALLLPDATVLTGGGGAPGPVKNLNAETYYPPYLFAHDGSGQRAPRPTLAMDSSGVLVGQTVGARVGADDKISRLTLVRAGSVTHSTNLDQRFVDLPFVQSGPDITATLPNNPAVLVPGYYMMFAFDHSGTPSVAVMFAVLPVKQSE